MPSEFPRTPKILKGALVAYESQFLGPIPNVIVFQYNPEQLSRTLAYRAAPPDPSNTGSAREDVLRIQGPPVETITISVELNAADQLGEPEKHPHTVEFGLHPALAALELLLYPSSAQVLLNQTLAKAGTVQLCPEDIPLVLFVWGASRVLPIRLTSFSVTEQSFDQKLNPLQAKVDLSMRVLTYAELKETSVGYTAYLTTQIQKEVLARLNLGNSAEQITGMLPF
ncbi:MAG: hypothetical protein GTO18_18810 [Anaerolineales bacterium]|nr:hypothetical protein [Anaerolineales bacterium]